MARIMCGVVHHIDMRKSNQEDEGRAKNHRGDGRRFAGGYANTVCFRDGRNSHSYLDA